MKSIFASIVAAAATLAALTCSAVPARAQTPAEDSGISSPLISRCAGKFGSTLREGDQAFPLFNLDGFPWVKIEHVARTVDGVAITDTLTGTGTRLRRRGQVISFRYQCLLDAKGEAVRFDETDLLPERKEALPPARLLRGAAYYVLKSGLPRGAELRVQLFDTGHTATGELLSEVVVRTSWLEPIPFILRLPTATRLDGRKLAVAARLAVGSKTLYRVSPQRRPLTAHDPKELLSITLEPVAEPRS